MWVEVKPSEAGVDMYTVRLNLNEGSCRLGFVQYQVVAYQSGDYTKYRSEWKPTLEQDFDPSPGLEEAVEAILHFQLGGDVAEMVPVHFNPAVDREVKQRETQREPRGEV